MTRVLNGELEEMFRRWYPEFLSTQGFLSRTSSREFGRPIQPGFRRGFGGSGISMKS